MADKVPIRAAYSGASALTGLATFASAETIGVAHGGTGVVTIGSNQLVTGNGTSAITSESNLTFDGTTLATTAFTASGDVSLDGGTFIFNESGADKDFRVEGDTDANLFIADASTDRIGIGTATPSHLLDVDGVANVATCIITPKVCIYPGGFSSGYVLPAADGSAGQLMCTDGSGALAFATAASSGADPTSTNTWTADQTFNDNVKLSLGTGGDADLYYDGTNVVLLPAVVGSGVVGIGTTAPTAQVTILVADMNGDTAPSVFDNKNVLIGTDSTEGVWFGYDNTNNVGHIGVLDTGVAHKNLALNGDGGGGNVGIGTAAPDTKLHAEGSTGYMKFDPAVGGSTELKLTSNSGHVMFGTYNGSHLLFYTDSTERMIINTSGNVGIGTTNPARKLDVQTSADISGVRAVNTNGSFTNTTFDASIDRASSTAYAFIYGHNNSQGDVQFNIRGDGNALLDETWQDNSLDYAEYFENTGPAIEIGVTVVLDDGKVRAYDASTDSADNIIGVNRPKSKVSGPTSHGSQWNKWHNKYLVDDYGRHIFVETTTWAWEHRDAVLYEDGDELPEGAEIGDVKTPAREAGLGYEQYEFIKDSTWTPPADATSSTDTIRKMNPDYDDSVTYESREERDEWSLIGLVGQVPMKKGETTNSRWIKMADISDAVERWMIR